ncbi:MAG: hypothetical protein HY852_23615 [Bradyrhizobium sp.]|nr:hypothetical protein [Bradyrhizobium sp.]
MLRAAALVLLTVMAADSALAADQVVVPHKRVPPRHVVRDPNVLITPADGPGGYLANLPGTPLLPGSSTLPGYYGRAWDYDYQGPYYGGPYVSYWDRLPYACGVYGYC